MQLRTRSKSFMILRGRANINEKPPLVDDDDKENSPLSMRRKLKQSITNFASRFTPRDTASKPAPTPIVGQAQAQAQAQAPAAPQTPVSKTGPSTPRSLPLPRRPATAAGTKPSRPAAISTEKPPVKPAEACAASFTPTPPATPRPRTVPAAASAPNLALHAVDCQTSTPTPTPAPAPAPAAAPISGEHAASGDTAAFIPDSADPVVPLNAPPSVTTLMINNLLARLAAGETIDYKLRNPPGYYDPDPECLHFMDSDEEEEEEKEEKKKVKEKEPDIEDVSTPTPAPTLAVARVGTPRSTPRTTPRRSRIPVPVKKPTK
ncbi:hypothetical protein Dda_2831 [Drechslerella dactyloides]|uniref:Uncharacterized protein n=1 Tax=Drechslerella dactyloides TaxID=74499 RepID=A0AAD6NKP4_DREDA|nr:hypothetical protein Dda_2831 [Drechslerella dactyloides]